MLVCLLHSCDMHINIEYPTACGVITTVRRSIKLVLTRLSVREIDPDMQE